MSVATLKPPRPYFSHSQFALFNRNPEEYYQQYYISPIDNATPKMTLGKIFQEAWCDPEYDYEKMLREIGYTPDYARAMRTALEHPDTVRVDKKDTEKILKAKGMGLECTLLSKMDALVGTKKLPAIIENKYGKPLTVEQVRVNDQFTWYMLTVYLKLGVIPRMRVQSFNSKNGIPTIHHITRTKDDFRALIERINSSWTRIVKNDFNLYA